MGVLHWALTRASDQHVAADARRDKQLAAKHARSRACMPPKARNIFYGAAMPATGLGAMVAMTRVIGHGPVQTASLWHQRDRFLDRLISLPVAGNADATRPARYLPQQYQV